MGDYVYLASPYTHPDLFVQEERFLQVIKAAGTLMGNLNVPIFSPIISTHPITVRYKLAGTWEYWSHWCRVMLEPAKQLWVLTTPGWEQSKGVQAEMEIARQLGIPIYLVLVQGDGYRVVPNA